MATTIYYLDLVNGNDSNSGLAWNLPKLTFSAVNSAASANDEVRIAKTTAAASVTGANFGWTAYSASVTTDADMRGSLAAGDYIGCTTAEGNGAEESYYCISAITATTITLTCKYGGTTKTEASVKKITAVITTSMANTKLLYISGGWTLAASPTRDSETWFRLASGGSSAPSIDLRSSSVASYLNTVGFTSNGFLSSANYSGFVSFCTGSAYTTSASVPFNTLTISSNSNVCSVGGSSGYQTTACGIYSTLIAIGCTTAGFTIGVTGVVSGVTCIAKGCGIGFNTGSISAGAACYAYGCTTGFNVCSPCVDATATSCGVGFSSCPALLRTKSTSCTTGVAGAATSDVYMDSHVSISDTNGIVIAPGYAAHRLVNCAFTTPVSWGISRSLQGGTTICIGCTIDAPSQAKAFQVVSGANYGTPQYLLQESFGLSGAYYANASVAIDKTTNPYSVKSQYTGSSGLQVLPFKIASAWAKSGQAQTLTVQYWDSTNTWSGSITPVLRLNGKTIATGSAITSITSTPKTLTFTATAGLVTSDGDLSIAIVPGSSNNTGVNWGNLTVTKA